MAKNNIILPICAILGVIIFGTCLLIFLKEKLAKFGIGKKGSNIRMKRKRKPEAIPKSRMDGFNQLIRFRFEINVSVNAINLSSSFISAGDHLAMNRSTDKKINNDGVKEEINADYQNVI